MTASTIGRAPRRTRRGRGRASTRWCGEGRGRTCRSISYQAAAPPRSRPRPATPSSASAAPNPPSKAVGVWLIFFRENVPDPVLAPFWHVACGRGVLPASSPDVLRTFPGRSPDDSGARPSAPPGRPLAVTPAPPATGATRLVLFQKPVSNPNISKSIFLGLRRILHRVSKRNDTGTEPMKVLPGQ